MTEREFNIALGDALRQERKRQHLTLVEVAERLHVSKSSVASWETGERTISAKQWKQYCMILGVGLDDFIDKYHL